MAINALQVAWLSRLVKKGIIRPGNSMIEFGPQDLLCSRKTVEFHSHLNPAWSKIDVVFDGEKPRPVKPAAFYELFGISRYKSVDGSDPRADWLWDLNEPFRVSERFDIATNFGTFEHVFNIGIAFRSIHDVLRPDGVALHVLPAFADIDHGFFNIHPTTYFDLAEANGYVIEDLCYVDRWDIRVRLYEVDLQPDYDFDALPIGMEQLRDPATLKNMTAAGFVENYQHPDTIVHGAKFPGRCFDYCLVALRKTSNRAFRHPMQGTYGGNSRPEQGLSPGMRLSQSLIAFAQRHLTPNVRNALSRLRALLSR